MEIREDLKDVLMQFNRNFKEFNKCKARYKLARGSAGSGKSVNIAQDFILKLSDEDYKGANLLCVRKVDGTNTDSTFAELKSAIFKIHGMNYDKFWKIRLNPISLASKVTGNKIIFRGMKDESQRDKVKSITFDTGKLTWIWVNKPAHIVKINFSNCWDTLTHKAKAISSEAI